MTLSIALSLAGIVLSFIALLYAVSRNSRLDRDKIAERLTKLETRSDLTWAMVEKQMIAVLHATLEPNRDQLLVKYQLGTLSDPEKDELALVLKKTVANESEDVTKRVVAGLLVTAMQQTTDPLRRDRNV